MIAQDEASPPRAATQRLTSAWLWPAVVWGAALVYAVLLSAESLYAHETFETGFDLAVYDQRLWLLSEGREPFSTVVSRPFLADHFEPALVLLTPLYWLGLGLQGILVAQSVALALTAPALYALARAAGAEPMLAAVPALLWLASPLVATANLFDFRPATFAPVLVVLSAYAAVQNRPVLLGVTAVLALGTKEELALVYLMLAAVLFVRGRRRQAVVLGSGAAACFVLALALIRSLGDSDEWFGRRFAGDRGDSYADGIAWILRNPLEALGDAVAHTGGDVLLLVLSTGGLCLLAPVWMLLALPTFAHNALSAYEPQHSLQFHYHLPVLTGLFVAAAVGAARVRAVERPVVRVAIAGALTWALGFALFGGLDTHDFGTDLSRAERARLERALSRIGEDEPVAAAALLIAHVSRRGEVYSLPEPFVQLDWGSPLTPADLAERAERVRFAAFQGTSKPFEFEGDMGAVYERLRANGFEVVARPDVREVVVLERRPRLRR